MKKRYIFSIAFCLYIGAILILCLMKPEDMPQTEFTFFGLPVDKVAHFSMFMPFPILIHLMFFDMKRNRWMDVLILAVSIILGIGTAIGTEYLQSLTEYRSPDINDIYADMAGMGIGAIAVLILILLKKRTSE